MQNTGKVEDYIRSHNMIQPGERVCLGLSGGADSVCLLLILNELKEKLGFTLAAFHVNHGLRGAESDRDENYVREICGKLQIPLQVFAKDVAGLAEEKGLSLEEAGREARKEAAEEACTYFSAEKTALAHNRNDCAETLLFHLARGTSLTGLAGIAPVSGRIIRPLLCLSREEIEEDLQAAGIPFMTDSTNEEDAFTRNRIRHHVLPVLKKEVNSRAVDHLFAAAEDIREAADYIRREAKEKAKTLVGRQACGDARISDLLLKEPALIKRTVLMETLKDLAGTAKDLSRVHIRLLEELFSAASGSRLSLPCGLSAVREYGCIRIGRERKPAETETQLLKINGITRVGEAEFTAETIKIENFHEKITEKRYTKWFDYDKISGSVVIRTRSAGDRLVVDAAGRHQKLSDYFINEKVPSAERDSILLLARDDTVLWVTGMRMSEHVKVTDKTKTILKVTLRDRSMT